LETKRIVRERGYKRVHGVSRIKVGLQISGEGSPLKPEEGFEPLMGIPISTVLLLAHRPPQMEGLDR